MGNIPKNGKLSAKAFFKGLNEEKADNTRVSGKHEPDVHATNDYQYKVKQSYLKDKPTESDENARENWRRKAALDHGKFMRGGTDEAYEDAAKRYNEEYDASRDYSKTWDREVFGIRPQRDVKNGKDMRAYEAEIEAQHRPRNLKAMQKSERLGKVPKKKSWAQRFFEGVE